MEMVLLTREAVVNFFKRFEVFILPILKFLLGMFVFTMIFNIGHAHESIEFFADSSPTMLVWLFALMFTVMPTAMSWILIILSITLQVSASIEVAAAVFIFLLMIFLFYGRMAVKESYIILFVVLAFHFNIPYLIPLIVGLYFPVTAIIPVVIGVFIHAQIPAVMNLLAAPTVIDFGDMEMVDRITEMPGVFTDAYTNILTGVTASTAWVFVAVIFVMITLLVYFVSRQAIDYSKEIAIGLGCALLIFGFLLVVMFTDEHVYILQMILWTIVCGVIAVVIRLFDSVLDYQRAESVQFEDDNNYYHVRIVPKVIMTKSKRTVRRIRPQSEPDVEE